jgi:aldose 1-epimerase
MVRLHYYGKLMSAISSQQRQCGILETGQPITCYSLRNTSGMAVSVQNYGGHLTVEIPDFRGEMHQITLGAPQLADTQASHLVSNSAVAHLPNRYGITFDTLSTSIWEVETLSQDKVATIKLSLTGISELRYAMESLEYQFTIEYTLTTTNELIIRSHLKTSLPLPLFITHHPIWNLTGIEEDISDHILQIWASHYVELDKSGFIDSDYFSLQDQPAFNFQQPQRIGEKWAQWQKKAPYDVCFRLSAPEEEFSVDSKMPLVARVKAPVIGRTLEVSTPQPAGLRLICIASAQGVLKGFCLAPTPLLPHKARTIAQATTQQETHYKLIW